MRKIVRQQNYLKELIESQGNRYLSVHALKSLVRSVLEPLLDAPESGVVLFRIENREGLTGLIKRLEFSEIEAHNFSDDSGNLIEKVWANTEFICVMTHRYVSIIIWDNNTGDKNLVRYYSLYNSKLQNEPLEIIKRNSHINITPFMEKYTPDRRDNTLLNTSIRRLLDSIDESTSDAVLGYAEKNAETLSETDYSQKKSRIAAHEIKNQLSICDLYSEIIRKHLNNETVDKDAIENAVNAISKSIKMANNSLISLKTKNNSELKPTELSELIDSAAKLSEVYTESKNIELQIENNIDVKILADSEKLTGIIINLIKNASEAFPIEEENPVENGKYIKIKTDREDDFAFIMISNNAPGINEPEKIFDEGFTTKKSGSGLGLWICKKSAEEMLGELELSRSSEDYTEFTIKLGCVD